MFKQFYARLVFYPTLAWNMLLGRWLGIRNWWDHIDSYVIVGAYPFARDVAAMRKEGVCAVVNTCEEYAGPQAEYSKNEIEQFRMPTTDFTHPKLLDVQNAVEFVQGHVQKGHCVYIHCKAGRARSATVALCWLVKYRDMTPEEAQSVLLENRAHVNPHVHKRPVVQEFYRQLIACES